MIDLVPLKEQVKQLPMAHTVKICEKDKPWEYIYISVVAPGISGVLDVIRKRLGVEQDQVLEISTTHRALV